MRESTSPHIRHPLVLLARHLAGSPISDTPWCRSRGTAGNDRPNHDVGLGGGFPWKATPREWNFYAPPVDCTAGTADPIPVERAQELMKALSSPETGHTETSHRCRNPEDAGPNRPCWFSSIASRTPSSPVKISSSKRRIGL